MSKHFITLALVLFSQLPVYGASPYNQTRSLVEKWVQTKKLVAQLKADWKEENEILNQSITALEREVSSVESAMGAVDKDLTQADKEFETATQEKDSLTQFGDRLKSLLAKLEQSVISLNRRLPAGLQQSVSSMIKPNSGRSRKYQSFFVLAHGQRCRIHQRG